MFPLSPLLQDGDGSASDRLREHVLYLCSDSVINLSWWWKGWGRGGGGGWFRARPGVPVGPRWLRLPADTGSTQSITKATRKATCKGQADLPHSFILREGDRGERGAKRE